MSAEQLSAEQLSAEQLSAEQMSPEQLSLQAEQLSAEQLSAEQAIVGGATVGGATVGGAPVGGAFDVGANVAEQMSRSNCRVLRSKCRRSNRRRSMCHGTIHTYSAFTCARYYYIKYTVPQVDKGTSLPCYYVQICRTGVICIFTCSTHFYIIVAVKGCSFVEG